MVFPFTLKGFPRKSGVLHFYIYFLVQILFTYMDTIYIYNTIHIYGYYLHIQYYSRIWVLFIQRQRILPESSIRAVEDDPSLSPTVATSCF